MVGHKTSPVHVRLDLGAEARLLREHLAQQLTSREARNAEAAGEVDALRALAGTGPAEHDEPHSPVGSGLAEREAQRTNRRSGSRPGRGSTHYPGPRQFAGAPISPWHLDK